MKVVRFDRLLASTALGLVLLMSSHAAKAQQPAEQPSQIVVPLPDAPPPPTAKDFSAGTDAPAAPQTAVAPAPAPAPVAAAPAAATPAVADSAVSDKLRETITGKSFDRVLGRKADRAGVEAFYSARGFKPLWVANGAAADRAKSAISYLAKADAVGLEPSDYPTPDFNSASTVDALADAELKLTASALTFARHAQIGRVHFTRVSADIQFDLKAPEPADVLAKLAANDDAGKALDSYNPPMAEFKALRAKLAELRTSGGVVAKAEEKILPAVIDIGFGALGLCRR